MADVIGPNSYLPGQGITPVQGMMCDEHPDRPATHRVVGETDSFGSELHDMCDECYTSYKNRDRTEERTGTCDWCKQHATDLSQMRDPDEGMAGPVYNVCGCCRKKHNERMAEEYAQMDNDPFFWDDFDD